MSIFHFDDYVFTKNLSNPSTCFVGTNNDTEGNGAISGTDYRGPSYIPPFVFDESGIRFRVTGLGKYAFRGCLLLKHVALPRTLEFIGWDSFLLTSIEHLFVPSNVEVLGYAAFSNMQKLNTIIFESGSRLREIGGNCFSNCISLKSILLPPLVAVVGNYAFSLLSNIEFVIFCSDKDISSASNLFYKVEHEFIVYVTSQYPNEATFGGFPVTVSDSHCRYYHNPHTHEYSSCAIIGPSLFLNIFSGILVWTLYI